MSKKVQKPVEMVQIRSVKNYFNEFIVNGLKGKTSVQEVDLIDIKAKLLKAFQQELYGQIVFKLGPEAADMKPDDLADMEGIQNILQQTFRKWRRLCILCSEHGLGNFFHLEDLQDALKDGPGSAVVVPGLEEDVTDKLEEILPPDEKPVYLEKEVANEGEGMDQPNDDAASEVENGAEEKEADTES